MFDEYLKKKDWREENEAINKNRGHIKQRRSSERND
jgi:hypothetical protein